MTHPVIISGREFRKTMEPNVKKSTPITTVPYQFLKF